MGGSFVLGLNTVSGVFVTTPAIAFDANAAAVKSAVETAFRNIAAFNDPMNPPTVAVTTRPSTPSATDGSRIWHIAFTKGFGTIGPRVPAWSLNSVKRTFVG